MGDTEDAEEAEEEEEERESDRAFVVDDDASASNTNDNKDEL